METKSFQPWISPRLLVSAAIAICAVFLVLPAAAQNYAVIRSFSPLALNGTNSDGAFPLADLLVSGQTLYGVANAGGSGGNGTVFKINEDGSGFAVLHNFSVSANSATSGNTNSDGVNPHCKLLLIGDTLYGTATRGGINGGGTIFSVKTNGNNFTVLTNFSALGANGDYLTAGLVSPDGATLFGTAENGGSGAGVLFKISTNGSNFSVVRNFSGTTTNGAFPVGQLLAVTNILYGTTYAGASNDGCIYKINTNGMDFTLIKSFSPLVSNTNNDGAEPFGRLMLSGNVLYGTTYAGGASSNGVIFRVNTDGTGFTNLYSFSGLNGLDNFDGALPQSAVTLAGHTLYGTAPSGGAAGSGTIFSVNTDGSDFYTLRTFDVTGPYDGRNPDAGFALSGATFFGTTERGGINGNGTIYRYQWDNTPPMYFASSSNKIILSWPVDDYPTNDFNFTLQTTHALGDSPIWTNALPASVIIGEWNTVTNSAIGASQFYRISPF